MQEQLTHDNNVTGHSSQPLPAPVPAVGSILETPETQARDVASEMSNPVLQVGGAQDNAQSGEHLGPSAALEEQLTIDNNVAGHLNQTLPAPAVGPTVSNATSSAIVDDQAGRFEATSVDNHKKTAAGSNYGTTRANHYSLWKPKRKEEPVPQRPRRRGNSSPPALESFTPMRFKTTM